MNKSKGFTIIELLVVIAIIAVLASIVLVNVTSYINKGKDSAIKGNMATIMTNGAVFFDANSSFSGFSSDATYTVPAAAITSAGGTITVATKSDSTAYCVCSTLKASTDTYCVDSTGYKKQTVTACATRCPAAGACVD